MKQVSKVLEYPAGISPVAQLVNDDGGDEIDLRGLFLTLWRGKWIIAVCTVIAAVLAVFPASQLPPRYVASAKVMFDVQDRNIVNLGDVLADQKFSNDTLQNQIEILRSTSLIDRVVDELGLDRNPEFNPTLRVRKQTITDRIRDYVTIPPAVNEMMINLGIKAPPSPRAPPDPAEFARRVRLIVINNVQGGLSLRPVQGSRVIQISFTSGNPRTSAQIVNAMTDLYIVDQLEAKLEATRSATSWLSDRVDELQTRVRASEDAVEAARAKLSLEAGQSLKITNQQLEALNASLSVARNTADQAEAQFQRLTGAMAEGRDLGAISEFRESNLIRSLRQQESELLSQEVALKVSVREGHPALVRLQFKVAKVQQDIKAEADRIVAALQIDLESILLQESALVAEVRDLETKALDQSREEVQLRQLEREAQANRLLYENFLGRLQETSLQEDLQTADARVLSPAEPPIWAMADRQRKIVMVSTLAGLMVGIAIVFLLDRLNNTFRAPQQLEEMTKQNVLALVPSIGSRVRRTDVVKRLREKPNSSLAEAIRNLRTSILFSNLDKPPKVVMFTSSVPREGKSTTSMLMALTSRQMGKSAIIVDCDLRMPALARIMKVDDDKPGLLSIMQGTAEVMEAIHKDEATGLHVLMAKSAERPAQINAADILASKRFGELIKLLSGHYDLVILDTPPTLVVTDARIVSKSADAVVYIVRWDKTPRGAVLEGLKELKTIDAPITGIALTMVNESRAAKYSYDGYSYYKGKYRDYYAN